MPRLTTTAETAAGLWRHPFTTRSRRLLFPAILLICILLYLLPLPRLPSTPPPPPHVAIINGPRHNFELVWPLLYTFTQQRLRKLDLVAATPSTSRHGILHFLDLSASPKPLSLLPPDRITLDTSWNPDLFVLASCMHDMSSDPHIRYAVERVLTGNPRTTVVCVVNEVHAWKDPKGAHRGFIKKWGKLGRVRFLVLSEHVRKSLRTEIKKWDIGTPEILPVFVPVFPVADATLGFDPELPLRKGLGIPGKYDPARPYKSIFASVSQHSQTLRDADASLHLVGFGTHPGPVADNAKDLVTFHDGLNFDTYWRTLRGTLAIAPAFANDLDVKDQASISVATSLVVGVPLICGKGVLKAYTYLKEEDVWLLQEGEGVVEGFVRVLKKGGAEWRRKREVVAKRREKCMRENVRWVGKFLERMARPPVVVPEKVTVPKTVPVAQ